MENIGGPLENIGGPLENMPKSRAEAIAAGSAKYLPDRPCKRGHNALRYASTGNCSACLRESSARFRLIPAGTARRAVCVPDSALPALRDILGLFGGRLDEGPVDRVVYIPAASAAAFDEALEALGL